MPQGAPQVLTIREGLTKGLRRDSRNPRNTEAFVTFQNLKPTEFGAQEYTPLSDGTSPTGQSLIDTDYLTYDWPWPQLFRGKEVLLAAENQAIYTPSFNSEYWSDHASTTPGDAKAIYQAKDVTTSFTIPSASQEEGIWHFVDFGEVWALVRPNCTLFKGKHRETTGNGTDVILGQGTSDDSYVVMRTACDYKDGRAFAGGFDGSHFWGNDWKYIWREWAGQQQTGVHFDLESVDSNWVMWSKEGGGDLLWMFLPDYAYNPTGTLSSYPNQTTPSEPILLTYLKNGDMGMMPMPWSGNVEMVKQLGDAVMVYGSNGISALVPTGNIYQPFTVQRIFDTVGINGRGAAGGDKFNHVFIDSVNNELWHIDSQLKLQRLGYREFLTYTSIISYDQLEQDFYISSNTAGAYILTRNGGFCNVKQNVMSVIHEANELVASVNTMTGGENGYAIIKTDKLDMGTRALKNINMVEIGGEFDDSTNMSVSIHYRYDGTGAFTESTNMTVSNGGLAPFNLSGVEFQIQIQAVDSSDIQDIDYINVHWAIAEDRYVRGMNNG